ncbi:MULTISPECIES: bifunctional adenosylcobinamide kinase/adenosylcobinamide-phosphate guanylyltransferase [Lacrimispora]|jgi:adenosylcobinamide kinase/adenosylcobinamide-phosphate guanylyltransferase|uniref:bifunctional adenosylcobinamide kinase/adenosylcobinamide-phosphate guanylyltransferase n=1 Tax=Lacrimispora TaxID=2719231 RepID=UPI000BE3BA37|nr:bifunctional adenosylcobinamide kinase/adenosylcobinamide-phosphate guanylyltransferase [Lacrimispora amygdalina]MDK2966360.1 adenosylcobinamide kinase / adenosylcobinamide-phosphate guanylyltransferase [Lacrimispora sp.]
MRLIIGGAWQGKLSFALQLTKTQVDDKASVAEGATDPYQAAFECRIIHNFHEYVRRLLKDHIDPDEFISDIREKNPEVLITINELGCGIVPQDPFDRTWRESAGRAAVKLAKYSGEVYRMVCGIPDRIK